MFEPDAAIVRLLQDLRPTFKEIYATLKPIFEEASS
jgi:hypothetical protein